MEFTKTMIESILPAGLTKNGFDRPDGEAINIQSLDDLRQWIRINCAKTKSIIVAGNKYSYILKHTIERRMDTYISNGELIAAMLLEGYSYRRNPGQINCWFNVNKLKTAEQLKKEEWNRNNPRMARMQRRGR